MTHRFAIPLVLIALVGGGLLQAQSSRNGEVQFKAAQQKEEVEGDLKGAIEQYAKIAQTSDRALAARALVRMAECYQKLGDAESRKIYERLVRDYADQKEAVTIARARLSVAGAATLTRTRRAVWTGPYVDPFGQVSPDGRSITFVDWARTNNLMVYDVVNHTERALTSNLPWAGNPSWVWTGAAEYSAISKDGRQVAYAWNNQQNRYELYLAPLQGTGQPRRLMAGSDEISSTGGIAPYDWSPDGKWLAVELDRKDLTRQIALVAVADGSVQVLKSLDWRGPERIFFSPDSKYLAYDRPVSDTGEQYDIFVLAIDGSRETPVVVHPAEDHLMGWSPDGRQLLFSSDRMGSVGLWALTVANGTPQGTPELLEPNLGAGLSLGVTASGALYLFRGVSARDVKIAPIDLDAGKLVGPPVSFTQGFLPDARIPDWSPDGKYLAYQACENGGCLAIRSVVTGQVRRLPRTLRYPTSPQWSPDGRSLLTRGRDLRGRDGVFQVDAQSGEATAVILSDEIRGTPQWSPDGRHVYFNRGPAMVERELASGAEREIRTGGVLSPDGRYLAFRNANASTGTSRLAVVPFGEAQPRDLLRLTQPEVFVGPHRWTPDSSAVLFLKNTGSRIELWLAPVTGSQPRKLDIDPSIWTQRDDGGDAGAFSLSKDGRSIAFLMGKNAAEVWALENFLPAVPRALPPAPAPGQSQATTVAPSVAQIAPPTMPNLGQITMFDRGGKLLGKVGEPGHYFNRSLSPDGARVAVMRFDPRTLNADTGPLRSPQVGALRRPATRRRNSRLSGLPMVARSFTYPCEGTLPVSTEKPGMDRGARNCCFGTDRAQGSS